MEAEIFWPCIGAGAAWVAFVTSGVVGFRKRRPAVKSADECKVHDEAKAIAEELSWRIIYIAPSANLRNKGSKQLIACLQCGPEGRKITLGFPAQHRDTWRLEKMKSGNVLGFKFVEKCLPGLSPTNMTSHLLLDLPDENH